MLKLHTDLAASKSPDAQLRLQREIKATDAAIDQLVYQLYDLTPDEIAIVEAASGPAALVSDDSPENTPTTGDYLQATAAAAHHHVEEDSDDET